jgi:cell division protein FtsB
VRCSACENQGLDNQNVPRGVVSIAFLRRCCYDCELRRQVPKRFNVFTSGSLILLATVLIATYFLAAGGINALRQQQLKQQEHRLQAEIGDLRERYERLQALEEYLDSDEYVEAVVREQLGLVKEGETSIIAISSRPAPEPEPGESHLWWDILIR